MSDQQTTTLIEWMRDDARQVEHVAGVIYGNRQAVIELIKRVSPICPSDEAAKQLSAIMHRTLRAFARELNEACDMAEQRNARVVIVDADSD